MDDESEITNLAHLDHPRIDLSGADMPATIQSEELHDELLAYIQNKLSQGKSNRLGRLQRFANIDKMVSTWHILSDTDSQRKSIQERTGDAQAIAVNLPLANTHIDDMVAFYAAVYYPPSGAFTQTSKAESAEAGAKLVDKLNADAKSTKYYKSLTLLLRSLLKYNVGGLRLSWESQTGYEGVESSEGVNRGTSIDMYNFMWDPMVHDPADIPKEAEWAATMYQRSRMWLVKRERQGMFSGVSRGLDTTDSYGNGMTATYYRHPPSEAGVTAENPKGVTGSVDWTSYGATLASDDAAPITGHEVIEVYMWLNPSNFKLGEVIGDDVEDVNDYRLWRFTIMDDKYIIRAEQVGYETETQDEEYEIPYYCGRISQDDMGENQRTTAELLEPFQQYASFLINANIASTRSSTFGLQAYDPTMFDLSQIAPGTTSGRIKSKIAGRDVRSGLYDMRATSSGEPALGNLQMLMGLLKEFFPAQALPAQVAGMDRAITSQVSAVMQGVTRRLHMIVTCLDSDTIGPYNRAQYRNLAYNGALPNTSLTEKQANAILGSGLQQLNREAAEAGLRQLLFALIQNPESAAEYDIPALMDFWSSMFNISQSLSEFRKPQEQQQQQAQQPPQPPVQ